MSIDQDQVAQAVRSLVSFEETNNAATSSSADPTSYGFWMIITTKLMPDSSKVKPHRIPLLHSLINKDSEVCLLTKDPQREYKNLVAETGVSISKVIGLSKLKAKYTQYEAKRKLCASYDLFLADERIVTLLPPLLGKVFFTKKKQPATVDVRSKRFKREIESALGSAFFYPSAGVCNSVKVGKNFQTPDEVVANIMHSVEQIVSKLPEGWSNVQSIALKTDHSPNLPIFDCLAEKVAVKKVTKIVAQAVPVAISPLSSSKGSSSRKSTSQKDSILVPAGEEGVQKEMKKTTEKNSSVSASRVSAKKGKVEKISNIVESPKPVAKTTKAALKVTKKK